MAKENFSLSAKDFAGTFFFMNVPVVELDTIKASDAFGPGSSPGGHTKNNVVFCRKMKYDILSFIHIFTYYKLG